MAGICAQRPLITLDNGGSPDDLPRSRDLFGVGLRELARSRPTRMFPPSDGKPELTALIARLGSPWISSHISIRVPTAAFEAEALAGLLCGRPRD